jgi:hypothetical protein
MNDVWPKVLDRSHQGSRRRAVPNHIARRHNSCTETSRVNIVIEYNMLSNCMPPFLQKQPFVLNDRILAAGESVAIVGLKYAQP